MPSADNTEKIIVPVAPPTQPWPHLVVLAGPEIGKVFRLSHQETTIGRSREADVQFSSPSVSRMHAVVRIHGSRVTIEDQNSKNGVFVGISSPERRSRLIAYSATGAFLANQFPEYLAASGR